MWSRSTGALSMSRAFIQVRQSDSATQAPVIEAVRVPPSAWMTSQSMVICRSPRACRSITERNERPISRWISTVRPPCLPAEASRRGRSGGGRGNKPDSAGARAAALLAGGALGGGALGGGARQHAVFGGDPAATLALEPGRQPLLQAGGHQHMGIAEFHETGAFGVFHPFPPYLYGPHAVASSSARPHRV